RRLRQRYMTGRIVSELQRLGFKAVGINIDGWLNLPHKVFSKICPVEHSYEHAIRFDEMLHPLVCPVGPAVLHVGWYRLFFGSSRNQVVLLTSWRTLAW